MSEYAQLDSPNRSRPHPAHSHNDDDDNDDDKSFRSLSSKFSRASRKSLKNGELGVSLISSQEEESSSSCDRESYNGNAGATADSSPAKNGAMSPSASVPPTPSSPSYNSNYYETTLMAQDDPFYMFRGDLVKKLLLVEEQLERYLEVVRTTVRSSLYRLPCFNVCLIDLVSRFNSHPKKSTTTNIGHQIICEIQYIQDTATNAHQIKETKKLLKRHLKAAESTLSDLETTIRVVERNRSKFPHITDAEITNRRSFVADCQQRMQTSKEKMQSEEVKDKLLRDEKAKMDRKRSSSLNNTNHSIPTRQTSNGDDLYLQEEDVESSHSRSETIRMMQQQDNALDGLSTAVTRVSHMAETIHEEIEMQNKMLSELEDDLVDAEEQLGVVMGKLGKLLKTKSRCQIGLILVLSLIVLVLFFLVLYT
ncbi:hypothetical protein HJC23_008031 [Cyclotella cryptica]|uniref:t-SNARE coiled-coil homology domain-containing protein n=1 Tax=Cyclotella cryptica TaxID=29204 RepID=A0ABD3Q315_9STRA